MVILRWQLLTPPRDVMTDDLLEICMSKTRMSYHFIIHNAQCLLLKLAYRCHSLALCHLVAPRLTCAVALTGLARQFKRALSLGRSFLLHMHNSTTERGPILHLGALFVFTCSLLLGCSPQQLLIPTSPVLLFRIIHLLSLHHTKALATLASICSGTTHHTTTHHTTALPPTHCNAFILQHKPLLPFTHLQHGRLGDRRRCRHCFCGRVQRIR